MRNTQSRIIPIRWDDAKGEVVWLDNTMLPAKEIYRSSKNIARFAKAIKSLELRGAPVLGEAGAFGIAMAANNSPNSVNLILKNVDEAGRYLFATRPTAVNLGWGIGQISCAVSDAAKKGLGASEIKEIAIDAAKKLQKDNIAANQKIGDIGKKLIHDGDVLITVCNAGTLAADGIGTATAPLRAAWSSGIEFTVLIPYTAPLYQGARLTAWELKKDGIPIKVITDNATGHLIREENVCAAFTGADRILGYGKDAGNVYNKIGTYNLAILLKHHGGKLYVAAPTSTIDPKAHIKDVRIEQRDPKEVTNIMGKVKITPKKVEVRNPAFDRTPPELVSGIITELGMAKAPYSKSLPKLLSKKGSMVDKF